MGHGIDINITHFFVYENWHFLFGDFLVEKNIFAWLDDVVEDLIGDWDWLHILIYYVFVKYIFILQFYLHCAGYEYIPHMDKLVWNLS